jgi:hypothetical protein
MNLNGYTKTFGHILTSSIWQEDDKTLRVFLTIMVGKDRSHFFRATIPGLANMARVTVEECERALQKLEGPDKYSRTKEYEGRRIKEVEGGWIMLNGEKYRKMLTSDERRAYYREKKRDERVKKGDQGWRQRYEKDAATAVQVQIPEDYPPEVENAVKDFFAHRYQKATQAKIKSEAFHWDEMQAAAFLVCTSNALNSFPPERICARIHDQISRGFRGAAFDRFYV